MSEFLLLHDHESKERPAAVRKSIITLIIPSEDYLDGAVIFTKPGDEECVILEAEESVTEIYNMLNN